MNRRSSAQYTRHARQKVEALLDSIQIPGGKDYLSHSGLARFQKLIFQEPDFFGNDRALEIGTEIHKRILEPHRQITSMWEDEVLVADIVEAALGDEYLSEVLDHDNVERELVIQKGSVLGILDIRLGKAGIDLKTTSATTESAFLKSMDSFDYWRQAWIYKYLGGLESFHFVAISKKYPHKVFTIQVEDYPEKMMEAGKELVFLLTLYKQYYDQ